MQFSAPDIGTLFEVQISTTFPDSTLPTYEMKNQGEPCRVPTAYELRGPIKRVLKSRLLSYERNRLHGQSQEA